MKKTLPTALVIFVGLLFFNHCAAPNDPEAQNTALIEQGTALLNQRCISCHAASDATDAGMGPTLGAIEEQYLKAYPKEADFVENMTAFLLEPTTEKALMPEAVQQFGLMAKMDLSKADYEAVATAFYVLTKHQDDQLDEEQKRQLADYQAQLTLQKGKEIALATKAVLGKNLMTAIQNSGPEGALAFCHEKAVPLTDSVALDLSTKIKRVSDQPRNPDNAANVRELAYIRQAKTALQQTGKIKPSLQEINGKMVGYYPILTNDLCLKCHGDPDADIDFNTKAALQHYYPNDQAVGYTTNALRGIWVVEMDKVQ